MAIFNLKSTVITNRDATPQVINDARLERGTLRSSLGSVTAGTTDTGGATYLLGSTYVIASLPSTAVVRDVKLTTAALTSGVVSIGVARSTAQSNGLANPLAISATATALFASAQSVAAALSKTSVINQSGNNTITNQALPLWQACGTFTADPGGTLDIVILVTTTLSAGGLIGLEVQYVDNGT